MSNAQFFTRVVSSWRVSWIGKLAWLVVIAGLVGLSIFHLGEYLGSSCSPPPPNNQQGSSQVAQSLGWYCSFSFFGNTLIQAIFAIALSVAFFYVGDAQIPLIERMQGLGIVAIENNRHGSSMDRTQLWIDRIKETSNVTIVGTSSRGWFIYAHDSLSDLLRTDKEITINFYHLDPLGDIWRSRIDPQQKPMPYDYQDFLSQYVQIYENLELFVEQDRVQVFAYDSEPVSAVITDEYVYYGVYIPTLSRKDAPELTINKNSSFGKRFSEELLAVLSTEEKGISFELDINEIRRRIDLLSHLKSRTTMQYLDTNLNCDFCKEQRQLPNRFSQKYPEIFDSTDGRFAYKGEHFFVIPTLGQIVEDYALITSTDHVTCSADLMSPALAELEQVQSMTLAAYEGTDYDVCFFEHGMPCDGGQYGGCGIDHLHIHAVPIPKNKSENFRTAAIEFLRNAVKNGDSLAEISLAAWNDAPSIEPPYVLLQCNNEVAAVKIPPECDVQSQAMRRFLCEYLQIETEYEWQKFTDEMPKLMESKDRLAARYSQ